MNKKAVFSILVLAVASVTAIHVAIPKAQASEDNAFTKSLSMPTLTCKITPILTSQARLSLAGTQVKFLPDSAEISLT